MLLLNLWYSIEVRVIRALNIEVLEEKMDKREKVISILKKNGLESYIPLFEKNNLMDKKLLSKMTERQFERIGIDNIGDRKRLVQIFKSKGCLIAVLVFVAVLVAALLILHFTGILGNLIGFLKVLGGGAGVLLIIFLLFAFGS